ncbi:MAG: MBG domain-containing protein [Acutalibacteraceae bacterium]|nr:MBG domain-containing protein [Acutalibacteraceae bacterium]
MKTKFRLSNRIMSLLLALVMVLGMMPITGFTVSAAAADDVWNGSTASQAWESGSGTAADPYVIMTAAQLAKLASNVNSGTQYNGVHFKLGANLDLDGDTKSWISIGTSSSKYYFDGYFDGNNKTISNISKVSKNALFGYIGTNGKLTNLTVSNVTITSGSYAAGIVYHNKGTIENCTISNATITTTSYAAGLVIENYGTVTGCTASNVSISSKYIAAGLMAQNEGTITNCKVTSGEVTGANPGNTNDSWVAGVCGVSRGGTISDCSNAASASANAGRYCAAAGIVAGPKTATVQVTGCANTGSITSSIYAGGISGYGERSSYVSISNSYNTGTISGSNVGGIAAVRPYNSSDKIINCYNAGLVTGTSYAGGIAGNGGNGIVENTHNYAKVVSNGVAGYIVSSDAGSWPGKNKLVNNHAIEGNVEAPSVCRYLDSKDVQNSTQAVIVGSTVEEFKNGTIYELLQNANGSIQVWGQTIGTDNYPVFFNGTNLPVDHTHEFTYTANSNIITETCVNDCEHTETATLNPPTSDVIYDGSVKECVTVGYSEGWQGGELTITYENNKNAGTATAKIQKESAIASVNFVIKEAEPNEETPTSLVATYGDTLADVILPSGWSWRDSSLTVGDVGSKTFKAVFTPSDSNYKTIEADVPVVVEPATPSYTTPTGFTATYGDSLFMIDLPDGWSWRAPTAKVGNVGEHQHSAYYTPADSNYKQVTVDLTVTVTKAPLTVKAKDHTITYGDAPVNAGVEYEGFVSGDDESVLNGSLTYDYSYMLYGDVGVYDITPKGLSADNYAITFLKGNLTVEQKILELEWSNTVLLYNGEEQSPTATPVNTVNNDRIFIEVSTAINAGEYNVFATGIIGGKAGNYKLMATSHSFEIEHRAVSVGWGNSVFVYDGTEKFPELILSGIISGDDVRAVTTGAQINASDSPYVASITALSGEDASNYILTGTLTKEFTIVKADRAAPATITKTDETISKKADGTISGVTANMEYRKEGESTYEAVNNSILENLAAGKYYVRYQGDSNHNPSTDTEITIAAGSKLRITVPKNTVGYTVTTTADEVDYGGNVTITLTLHDGYSKTDAFKLLSNGSDRTQYLSNNGTTLDRVGMVEDIVITVEGIADITAPTAEMDVKGNKWTTFFNNITFGIFFKESQDVTITATDTGSGVNCVEYYLSTGEMSLEELATLTEWVEYNGTFKINPNNRYVVYAKVTDNAGNMTYINSDGLVLDNVAPTLEGIENGKTYYGDLTVIKSEEQFYDIESVTLDGEPLGFLEGTYGFIPADNAEHTVVVKDRAGNTTTYIVTVMKNYTVTYKADGIIVSTQTIGHGKDATVPEIPEKEGYTQTAPTWDKEGVNITTDTVINAVYTINQYTVTIPSEQIGYTLETDVETIEHGGEVYISISTKEGYEKTDSFALKVNGEAVELTEYNNVVVVATKDLVITVEGVELKTYTITFKDQNGIYKTFTYKHGESVVMPEVPTKEGYTVKWDTIIDKATGDVTVNAVYTEIPKDIESEKENKPSDTNSPQTGDNSNIVLWIALLFISGGVLITLTVIDRKKKIQDK